MFQSGQNLNLMLLNDIQLATDNGLIGPKWGRAYHGNVTEHGGEQGEVEGMHGSVVLTCRIVSA